MAGPAGGVEQAQDLGLLLLPQRRGIVRMVEHQALDAVRDRPFAQRAADVGAALEAERDGARQLDRAADPHAIAGGVVERLLAEPAVEQDAEVRPAAGGLARRLQAQLLEVRDVLAVMPAASAIASSWARWSNAIASSCGHARVRVVDQWICSSRASLRSALVVEPCVEEILQLGPARHRRRAAVPRHRERAAGIGVLAAVLDRLVAQVAAQKAAHEGVAGAEHVEHLDREARAP